MSEESSKPDEVIEERPEVPRSQPAKDDPDERAKRMIALIIATVAVLGALLAFLRADAGAHADEAKRRSKQLAIQASGEELGGQVALGFDLSAAQTWLEMAKLAQSADNEGAIYLPAPGIDNGAIDWPAPVSTVEPSAWYAPVRDKLAATSPLLQAPYNGNALQYYGERSLVQVTQLSEGSVDAGREQSGWGGKSNSYIFYLALLASGGSLLGLSITMHGRARAICLSTGVGVAAVGVALALTVYFSPVTHLPSPAISDYAQGVSYAYQGKSADVDAAKSANTQAVAAFDKAISEAPDYPNALFERANALYALRDYDKAASSYGAAIDAGRNDTGALWNLGWVYYLNGDFADAIQVDRQALSENPDLVTVRMNLGLTLLASGDLQGSRSEYQSALMSADRQVQQTKVNGTQLPYSFWKQIDRSARDLDALVAQLGNALPAWGEAPALNSIQANPDLKQTATDLATQLKDADVALEYTGALPVASKTAIVAKSASPNVSTFSYDVSAGRGPDTFFLSTPFQSGVEIDLKGQTLVPAAVGASDTITTSFPASISQDVIQYDPNHGVPFSAVYVYFDFAGMQDGKELVWKVYHDGVEDHSLRWQETWQNGTSGYALKPVNFVFVGSGEYMVELYYDSHLLQSGEFRIEPR